MEDKDFLINKLKLSDAIISNDSTSINTVSMVLNNGSLTKDQLDVIKSFIISIYQYETVTSDTVKLVINSINGLNKDYLLALYDAQTYQVHDRSDTTISAIKNKLNAAITFDNDTDKLLYFSILSNIVILLRDRDLIALSIQKLQS